jgi:hypothetical protein
VAIKTGQQLRAALETRGLTQTGLAKTLQDWNDPRDFTVILRWIQRAISPDADPGPHVQLIINTLDQHIKRRNAVRDWIQKLEAGQAEGTGDPNATPQLAWFRSELAELDNLLRHVTEK